MAETKRRRSSKQARNSAPEETVKDNTDHETLEGVQGQPLSDQPEVDGFPYDIKQLEEPTDSRLEPDPHQLVVEGVKIINDAAYYQRLYSEAEKMVKDTDRERKRVRARIYLDIKTNGTKYGLDKDKASAQDANAIIDGVQEVIDAQRAHDHAQFARDHFRGVLEDFRRKDRRLNGLEDLWRQGYYSGPEGMPQDFDTEERRSDRLNRMEELTGKVGNFRQKGGTNESAEN